MSQKTDNGVVRSFESGATRDTAQNKLEPWGFTSALVEKRFSEYMHENRTMADGSMRASDNWKKGIPEQVYKHSLSRHVLDLKLLLEGFPGEAVDHDMERVLCAILFNAGGLLDSILRQKVKE